MIKKINDFLATLPMTIVGSIFLLLSFILRQIDIRPPMDPAWITVIICGLPLLYLSIWRIIHNKGISKISSAFLITIAMFAAIAIGDLFAAGEVAFIMALGAILEDMTANRAKKGLHKLLCIAPTKGRKILMGKEIMISAEEIRKKDVIRILPGEAIPVDGTIIIGETSVDQSIMTGESLPVDKGVGDSVFCGTINRYGTIDITATKVGQDSSLSKLIRMIQDAQNNQAPSQRIADKCASWLVPLALLIAVVTFFSTNDIVRAVTVLVVFCPCALVLATPTSIIAAIGQATKHGVIIKSGNALEKMGKVNMIAFDKTGTLTYGKLDVCDIIPLSDSISEQELLRITASAELKSEHPLGKAITESAKKNKLSLSECESFKMSAGKGIIASIDTNTLYCGNEKFLAEYNIPIDSSASHTLKKLHLQGKATVIIANSSNCIGIIALSDTLKPETPKIIQKLNTMNIKTVLLTGDHQSTADYLSSQIGITEVRANLLPEEKVTAVQQLEENGNTVCMIGDGVNDAPALKLANVGVAMGSMGSDIAIEAADIALMNDDISKIPYLKRLSNATVRTIKFAITLSMIFNFFAIILSVTGILTPTTGALVHNGGSCFVVLIAALLYDRKFD